MIRSDFASILASILEEDSTLEPAYADDFTTDDLHFAHVVEPNFTSYSESQTTQPTRVFSLETDIFKLTEALATEFNNSTQQRTILGKRAYRSMAKKSFQQEMPPWHDHKEWGSKENLAFSRLQDALQKIEPIVPSIKREPSFDITFGPGFTKLELKKIYRKLVLFSHPDRETGDLSLFIQVKADYQTLMAFLEKIA